MKSLIALAALLASAASAQPSLERSANIAELRRLTQALLDAVAPGDKAVWQRILDEGMIHVDENGVTRGKAQLLAELDPLPPGLTGQLRIDRFDVRFFGETAVVAQEAQESLDYYGQALHSRFRSLDTWRRVDGAWRLVGEQTSAVLKDPPAIILSRADLCQYAGRYRLKEGTEAVVRCDETGLSVERPGRPLVRYQAELRDLFFLAGSPRTRRIFLRDIAGKVTSFADRREGEDVVWQRVGDAPPTKRLSARHAASAVPQPFR